VFAAAARSVRHRASARRCSPDFPSARLSPPGSKQSENRRRRGFLRRGATVALAKPIRILCSQDQSAVSHEPAGPILAECDAIQSAGPRRSKRGVTILPSTASARLSPTPTRTPASGPRKVCRQPAWGGLARHRLPRGGHRRVWHTRRWVQGGSLAERQYPSRGRKNLIQRSRGNDVCSGGFRPAAGICSDCFSRSVVALPVVEGDPTCGNHVWPPSVVCRMTPYDCRVKGTVPPPAIQPTGRSRNRSNGAGHSTPLSCNTQFSPPSWECQNHAVVADAHPFRLPINCTSCRLASSSIGDGRLVFGAAAL